MEPWLAARARATPQALALRHAGQDWSYADLARLADRLTGGLVAMGVRAGAHVAVLLPNGVAYVALVHALARLGAVMVPLNTRLTVEELAWQVRRADARWLLHDDSTAPAATAVAVDTGASTGDLAMLPACEPPPPATQVALGDVQAIVFTSGTTGRPKGAMLTYGSHFWSATASAYRLGVLPHDRWLSILPLYHVGGLAVILRSCLYGTAVVLQDGFDLEAVNRSLDEDDITLVSLVPTMLYRLLPRRESWPSTLRLVLLGGAAAPAELLARAVATGVPVATTYGLTEAASQVATLLPPDSEKKAGSVGRPLLFSEVQIVDEAGRRLPVGERGEIVVRGPTVMAGYYGAPEETAAVLRDGWLHTGDIGYVDDDGDLWPLQRRGDVIISGGENVYPAEVEQVLRDHPGVAAVAVVGVPHSEWGEQVAAMIAPIAGQSVSVDDLAAFARARLAGYKLPRRWQMVAALPQTASGKVARTAVREAFTGDDDSD